MQPPGKPSLEGQHFEFLFGWQTIECNEVFVAADLDTEQAQRAVERFIVPVACIDEHPIHIEDYCLDFIAHENTLMLYPENRYKVTSRHLNAGLPVLFFPIILCSPFDGAREKRCKLFYPAAASRRYRSSNTIHREMRRARFLRRHQAAQASLHIHSPSKRN